MNRDELRKRIQGVVDTLSEGGVEIIPGDKPIVLARVADDGQMADCPKCDGDGFLPAEGAEGPHDNYKCPLCSGLGQMPAEYAKEYAELRRANEGLDSTVWALQQERVQLRMRLSGLSQRVRELEAADRERRARERG